MSIERECGEYILACDMICGNTEIFGSFQDAVDWKKDEGWKSRRIYGQFGTYWIDVCPECLAKEAACCTTTIINTSAPFASKNCETVTAS